VKVKTTEPHEVAFAVHKGSYQKLGGVFWKLAHWIERKGYEIAGPSVTVCYNDSHTALEEELVSECLFPVRKRE
jgi:effector-binding domain-containing protein